MRSAPNYLLFFVAMSGCAGHSTLRNGGGSAEAGAVNGGSAAEGTGGAVQTGGVHAGGSPQAGGVPGGAAQTGGFSQGAASVGGSGIGASCGSPDALGGTGSDAHEPDWIGALDDLTTRIAAAMCEYSRRCTNEDDFYSQVPGGCVAYRVHEVGDDYVGPLLRSLAAGRARYDANAMAECIAKAASVECGHAFNPWCATVDCGDTNDPWCPTGAEGTVPLGGDCEHSFDCEGTARCDGCPGKCVAVVPPQGTVEEGFACAGSHGACTPELVCVFVSQQDCQPPSCPPTGTCVAPLVENERCDASRGSGPEYSGCTYGLFCASAFGDPTRCIRPARETDPCGGTKPPCEGGLNCAIPDGETTGTCRAKTLAPIGEPCAAVGVGCVDPGRCALVGIDMASGQRDYRCVEPSASRGVCYLNTCPTDEFCPLLNEDLAQGIVTSTCQPVKATGESCGGEFAYNECGVGTTRCGPCGICERISDVGGNCSDDWGCFSRRCVAGVCVTTDVCP